MTDEIELEKKYFELVEMIAQNQKELIRLQSLKSDGQTEIALLANEVSHMNKYLIDHFRRFDLIYKIVIPLILTLIGLLGGDKIWITAKMILTGK
jgi:hypothetical protein